MPKYAEQNQAKGEDQIQLKLFTDLSVQPNFLLKHIIEFDSIWTLSYMKKVPLMITAKKGIKEEETYEMKHHMKEAICTAVQ